MARETNVKVWVGRLIPWLVDGATIVLTLAGVLPNWWATLLVTLGTIGQLLIGADWSPRK